LECLLKRETIFKAFQPDQLGNTVSISPYNNQKIPI
jgi:hypothetical protein